MFEGLKRRFRPTARERIDSLVGPLYVRQEHLSGFEAQLRAYEEQLRGYEQQLRERSDDLMRLLGDRFDAEAEENAILGSRVSGLTDMLASLQDEVHALRADLEDRERRSRSAS